MAHKHSAPVTPRPAPSSPGQRLDLVLLGADGAQARADLMANLIFLIEAGHVSKSSLITGGMLLPLQHPEAGHRLSPDPMLIPAAVGRCFGSSHQCPCVL